VSDVLDHPEAARLDWLKERVILQRRIKNQRRELRRLNAYNRGMDMLVRQWSANFSRERKFGYQHAAQIAETFRFGKRIANAIRRWS
jgi:hypothetical protein